MAISLISRRILVLAVVFCWCALVVWSGYQHRSVRRATALSSLPANTEASMAEVDAVTSPLLNKPAPNFKLRDLSGRPVSLADYRGKAVLINFWATWCAPCQVEMPWFITLQQKYAARGFTVLGIDKDYPEDLPKVPSFAKKMNLNYPVLYGDRRTYSNYGCCDYLPMSYYVDRAGTIRIATIGLGERETVETYIRRLLDASPPQPDTRVTASTAPAPPAPVK
ncbi:MAG: TlpA family protein disulfide reductase [Acidobacteriaceae bacterium]